MYISRSALLGPPNGIGFIAGVFIAEVDAAGFFAWCFAAKAADVDKPSTARLTTMILFMLELLLTAGQVPLNCYAPIRFPSARRDNNPNYKPPGQKSEGTHHFDLGNK